MKGGFGETPTITVPDSEPPSDMVVKTITKGKGPAVEAGETIVVNYAGVRWENGETFDSSFDRGSPAGLRHRGRRCHPRLGLGSGRAQGRYQSAHGAAARRGLR